MTSATELREQAEAIAADAEPVGLTGLALLRQPFPATQVGKLPRVTCKRCSDAPSKACDDHRKQECRECGNWMTPRHVHLDFVGHGWITQRLLDADPLWSWEPLAYGPDGLPALDRSGNLWIRLTVCGVTRIGVGDGKSTKEQIGDALRNAAMRFGAALDLWCKGGEDDKDTADHATPPVRWNAAMAKAELVNLCDGDKSKAQQVWQEAGGDDVAAWSADAVAHLLAAWEMQQADVPEDSEDVSR